MLCRRKVTGKMCIDCTIIKSIGEKITHLFWDFLTFICYIREVIKKFVDRCDEIWLSKAYKFSGEYKEKKYFISFENLSRIRSWYIILSTNTNYLVSSPGAVALEFRDVLQCHCFFDVTFCTLIHIWLVTLKSNTNFSDLFTWIWNLTNC